MRFLLLPLLLAGAGAAASPPAYVSFKGKPPVTRADGYAILLPQTGLWLEHHARDSVVYIRETDARESTMFVSVEALTLPDTPLSGQSLRDFVHDPVEPAGSADRATTEPVSTRVETDARLPGCARWRQTADDLLTTNPVTHSHPQVLSGGLLCVNAGNPAAGLQVSYSIMHMAPEKPDGLAAEGEAFLAGLRRKAP